MVISKDLDGVRFLQGPDSKRTLRAQIHGAADQDLSRRVNLNSKSQKVTLRPNSTACQVTVDLSSRLKHGLRAEVNLHANEPKTVSIRVFEAPAPSYLPRLSTYSVVHSYA